MVRSYARLTTTLGPPGRDKEAACSAKYQDGGHTIKYGNGVPLCVVYLANVDGSVVSERVLTRRFHSLLAVHSTLSGGNSAKKTRWKKHTDRALFPPDSMYHQLAQLDALLYSTLSRFPVVATYEC